MIRFLIILFCLAGTLIGSLHGLIALHWIKTQPSFFYETLIFLVFATALVFKYVCKIEKPELFVQFFLLLMVVKLIAFMGYNIFIALEDREGAKYNLVFFLIAYFVFTFAEVLVLWRRIASKNK